MSSKKQAKSTRTSSKSPKVSKKSEAKKKVAKVDPEVEVEAEAEDVQKSGSNGSKRMDTVSFEEISTQLTEGVSTCLETCRKLKNAVKQMQRVHAREMKLSRKNRRNKNKENKKSPSGFTKPSPVPKVLVEFLDLEEGVDMARTDVTKKLYAYIKENGLLDEGDKRKIRPNAALKKVLKLSSNDELTFFNLQKHMKKLYPPKKVDKQSSKAESNEEVEVEEPKLVKKTKKSTATSSA